MDTSTLYHLLAMFEGSSQAGFDPNAGSWITRDGKHVYLFTAFNLDELKPSGAEPGKDKSEVTLNIRGHEVKKTVYSDEYINKTSKYKYARSFLVIKNEEKIDRSLRSEMKSKDPKKRQVAGCMLLIQKTGMRVGKKGNKSKAKADGLGSKKGQTVETFGASTLQKKHVRISGDKIKIKFHGKSGVLRSVKVEDKDLADLIRGQLGGKDSVNRKVPLFDRVSNTDCSKRMHEFDNHYKTKDFRTAVAMKLASGEANKIISSPPNWRSFLPKNRKKGKRLTGEQKTAAKRKMALDVVKRISTIVSNTLGNKADTAKKNYINPEVFEHTLKEIGVGEFYEEFEPSKNDKDIDAITRGVEAISSKKGSLKSKMPVLVSLLGEDAVRILQQQFIDDSDEPIVPLDDLLSLGDEDDMKESVFNDSCQKKILLSVHGVKTEQNVEEEDMKDALDAFEMLVSGVTEPTGLPVDTDIVDEAVGQGFYIIDKAIRRSSGVVVAGPFGSTNDADKHIETVLGGNFRRFQVMDGAWLSPAAFKGTDIV